MKYLLIILTSLLVTTASYGESCEDGGKSDGKFVVENQGGEKVYVIKQAITVCGKVPKPNVVYVLNERRIDYAWENLSKDFLPKIRAAIKSYPF